MYFGTGYAYAELCPQTNSKNMTIIYKKKNSLNADVLHLLNIEA
jgi:hypothetical protein